MNKLIPFRVSKEEVVLLYKAMAEYDSNYCSNTDNVNLLNYLESIIENWDLYE